MFSWSYNIIFSAKWSESMRKEGAGYARKKVRKKRYT